MRAEAIGFVCHQIVTVARLTGTDATAQAWVAGQGALEKELHP